MTTSLPIASSARCSRSSTSCRAGSRLSGTAVLAWSTPVSASSSARSRTTPRGGEYPSSHHTLNPTYADITFVDSHHPLARELRLRFVAFGFCLLQGSRLESATESTLRARLYDAALAWFAVKPTYVLLNSMIRRASATEKFPLPDSPLAATAFSCEPISRRSTRSWGPSKLTRRAWMTSRRHTTTSRSLGCQVRVPILLEGRFSQRKLMLTCTQVLLRKVAIAIGCDSACCKSCCRTRPVD